MEMEEGKVEASAGLEAEANTSTGVTRDDSGRSGYSRLRSVSKSGTLFSGDHSWRGSGVPSSLSESEEPGVSAMPRLSVESHFTSNLMVSRGRQTRTSA